MTRAEARPEGRVTTRPARPVWWREVLLVAAIYALYTLTRNTLPAYHARARSNAHGLLDLEQHLGLDVERALNGFVAGVHPLAVAANYTYSLSHFAFTAAVLVWLFVARPHGYGKARTVLVLTTLLGLLGYWLYPLAPPRFFPDLGFIDTVVRDGTWGSWGSNAVTSVSNEYAAMPSMHVAWSIWCAAALVIWARRRWVRRVAVLYPVVVFLVIVGTANHWTLDAAGGLGAVVAAVSLYLVALRVRQRVLRLRASAVLPRHDDPGSQVEQRAGAPDEGEGDHRQPDEGGVDAGVCGEAAADPGDHAVGA